MCKGLVMHGMAEVRCKATWAFTKPTKRFMWSPLCVGKAACHGAITSSFSLRNKAAVFTVLKESNGFSASTITHTLQAPPHLSSTGPSTSGEAGQGLHPAFQGAPHRDVKPSHGCGMKGGVGCASTYFVECAHGCKGLAMHVQG